MATQSLTTISNLLKTQYLPGYIDTFQEDDSVVSEVLKRTVPADGGDFDALVRVGRNSGLGFRSDGETLPSAGSSTWVKHTIDPKIFYARVQVSGPAVARLKSGGPGSTKAFLKAFVDEADHTMSWAKKRLNFQLWGGQEGNLGVLSADPGTGTTLTLQAPGSAGAINIVNENAGTRYFPWASESLIDIVDTDGTTIHQAGISVTGVDHSAGTLTIGTAAAAAMTTGDFVVLGSGKTTSDAYVQNSFEGLQAALDNGGIRTSYHGLSRSTYPQLKCNVLENTAAQRDLSQGLVEDLLKTVIMNGGKPGANTELRMCLGLHSEIVAMELPSKRYNDAKLRPGYEGKIMWNGLIPVTMDVDCPYETIFLIDWDNVKFLEVDKFGFEDSDGTVLLRVADKDAYEARLRWMGELFVKDVHKMGVLRNLNDTTYKLRS